jgi:hypothetical protein
MHAKSGKWFRYIRWKTTRSVIQKSQRMTDA